MTPEQAERVVDWLNDHGEETSVFSNYSGRGMFGAKVTGITFRGSTIRMAGLIGFAFGVLELGMDNIPQRTDNLGLDYIIY